MIDAATQQAIDRALGAGDIAAAAALAEAALAGGQDGPLLLNLAAWSREEVGDYDSAQTLLDRALTLSPGDPLILAATGRVLRLLGRLGEALRMIDAALAIDSGNPSTWLERGYALEAGNSLAPALASYRCAAALDPGLAQAHAGAAAVAARTGEADDAHISAQRALALDPASVMATSALARLETEGGEATTAAARLQALLARGPLGSAHGLLIQGLLGDALAKSGDAPGAGAAFEAANRAFLNLHAPQLAGLRDHRAYVEAIIAGLTAAPAFAPQSSLPVPEEAQTHIFLLGYPRSGNTLAENILASLPGAEAIEERPTLIEAARAFLGGDDGLTRLATLDDPARFRAAYWAKVRACAVSPGASILIDMDPLKSVDLPLIARLFPAAKVVLMRRDPRDVVWSVFRTSFALNSATVEFSSLERAARHYDAVIRLTELCLDRLPLNVHIARYEALVADFDATTRALCHFIGVPWSETLRAFDKTALRRGVTTASASQVRRGLYDGSGQWRPFADVMAPVLPILTPWVEKFGYPA